MTDKKIQTKIASLEKKIEAKQNSLEVARERRRMSGKSKGVQSEREIKLSAEISNLRQELHVLKSQAKESVNEATVQYTGRETKDGVWRVFQNGKAVAVAGPFKSREEASAWIRQHSGDKVDETSDYMRRRQREEDIISGKRPARKKAPAQTSDYAKRRAQEKKQGLSEGKVKELSMDLKDRTMSEAEFKKKYGKTRAEMRKSFKSDTEKKKKVSEGVVQHRRLEELNEKAEKLADLYEKVKQRRDFETMSKIKSAMGRVAKKRNEIKESLGITESEDTPNPAYDYKFWDEMTPSEKIRSHTLGQGITVWNPQTRKYAVKFPVPKGQVAPAPNSLSEDSNITADQLDIGDEVIITGNVQFQGSTGVIDDFGRDKAFVVVNLYNHGKHSFHSSDVSFNDYAGSEEEDADWRERDGVYESMLEEALSTYKKLAGIKTSK